MLNTVIVRIVSCRQLVASAFGVLDLFGTVGEVSDVHSVTLGIVPSPIERPLLFINHIT